MGTNFCEMLFEIQIFSSKKMWLKMLSPRWQSFCPCLNVLTHLCFAIYIYCAHVELSLACQWTHPRPALQLQLCLIYWSIYWIHITGAERMIPIFSFQNVHRWIFALSTWHPIIIFFLYSWAHPLYNSVKSMPIYVWHTTFMVNKVDMNLFIKQNCVYKCNIHAEWCIVIRYHHVLCLVSVNRHTVKSLI